MPQSIKAQDTSKSILDINNSKLIKKINQLLDTNQKKINNLLFKKIDKVKDGLKDGLDKTTKAFIPIDEERPLPYEVLQNKKYTLGRRAYQNTVSQFNYIFHAEQDLSEILQRARDSYQEDFTELISFYDYDLSSIAKVDIDSIIYRCNANVVLHDLRSNWVDDAYLLLAKAYLYHKNFDTAGSLLQFINYSFDEKENGMDLLIGSNLRNTKGQFSIATKETNRIWENANIRNESLIWQARNYFETNELNEGLSLLQLLKTDALFPKRLHPFLNEMLAYGYYQSELYDSAANYLIKGLSHAPDKMAKARWTYLIAQMWAKTNNYKKAYTWYKKAQKLSTNPLIGVYAKINLVLIDSKQSNTPWLELAQSLKRISKRERFKPYSDIIYFEMAKLAIENKAFDKANEWLIMSIKKNANGLSQKQKAFELLANLTYKTSDYSVSRLAYDSINAIIKTNPNFELITLRKKWMPTIEKNDTLIKIEDTLQYVYNLATTDQPFFLKNWSSRLKSMYKKNSNIFIDETIVLDNNNNNNNNIGNGSGQLGNNAGQYGGNKGNLGNLGNNSGQFGNNGANSYGANNQMAQGNDQGSFYFDNKNSITLGKQYFNQKWGERPNVDNWRRKASASIIYNNTNNTTLKPLGYQIDTTNKKETIVTKDSSITTTLGIPYKLLINASDYSNSNLNWNKAAMENAQTFLLQLNDFDKALPIYQRIIEKNIDPTTTERALLDLSSQYIHVGNTSSADSIIQIVTSTFPDGLYVSKKNMAENKKKLNDSLEASYKEAYFLSQIGDWKTLSQLTPSLDATLRSTKWFAPFQFIKVKMYAQQGMDSVALILLDSVISLYNNERIRDRAKNIIDEIKKRKETESYLTKLKMAPVQQKVKVTIDSSTANATTKKTTPSIAEVSTDSKKDSLNNTAQVSKAAEQELAPERLQFTKDENEPHFIALLTTNVKEVLVKEAQNAFNYLNNDEFNKLHLNVTYTQFDDKVFLVWVGPFENLAASTNYLNKLKSRLSGEILSFIPSKQYELYILGKSNILQISTADDLLKYKNYMFKNIYK